MSQAGAKGSVSVELVQEALHAALLRNLDINIVLKVAGLDFEILKSSKARISAENYARLWIGIADLMDDEFFGLDSHGMRRGSFSLMSRAAVGAANLEHALRRALRFLHVTLDDFRGELVVDGDIARIKIHDDGIMRRLFAYGTFFILVHGLACWLVHRRIVLKDLKFRCPPPRDDSHYRTRFCDQLWFNAEETSISFLRKDLELKVVESQASVEAFLADAPANLLVKYRNDASTTSKVRRYLRSLHPQDWPELERLAGELYLSGTTMQRRLQQEGMSYQVLKDDLRRDIAIDLLSDGAMTVADVAHRIGFQETSAFHRAFKKWTGLSPGAYRTSARL